MSKEIFLIWVEFGLGQFILIMIKLNQQSVRGNSLQVSCKLVSLIYKYLEKPKYPVKHPINNRVSMGKANIIGMEVDVIVNSTTMVGRTYLFIIHIYTYNTYLFFVGHDRNWWRL
jgi:hypothetical protein